jgi:hypothetical protein
VLDLLAEAAHRMGRRGRTGDGPHRGRPFSRERMAELFALLDSRIERQRLERERRSP